ncbi:MAG: J domain-containing protein [Spirochaetaceae bacterium]|nr:MAG: J domain-containing protein [Spirochaetaceae bacterium]
MGKYEDLSSAREMFGISESETMGEIRRKMNIMLKKWHPDSGDQDREKSNEKTALLIEARKIIIEYCDTFKISFDKADVDKRLSPDELWKKSFGADHVWGGNW